MFPIALNPFQNVLHCLWKYDVIKKSEDFTWHHKEGKKARKPKLNPNTQNRDLI